MRPAGLSLLALTLAACAAPLTYRAEAGVPEVRRFDAGGLAVDVALTVHGGEAAARIRRIDWEVLVGDLPVGVGTTAVEAAVPAKGRIALALPLVLATGVELPAGLRPALARGGSVPVTVRGVVRVRDRDGDTLRLPFEAAARAHVAPGSAPARLLDESDAEVP